MNIFNTVVKVLSILVLFTGIGLLLYIFIGPSLGLIDAESASWGIIIAFPVIVAGIVSVISSFKGYTKTSFIIIVIPALVIFLNVWNQNRLDMAGRQRFANSKQNQVQQLPPIPQSPLPSGTVGKFYTSPLMVVGMTRDNITTVVDSRLLPPGLSLKLIELPCADVPGNPQASQCPPQPTVSGVPTQAGRYNFVISTASTTVNYALQIN